MTGTTVTANRLPNGHVHARIERDGKPYDFVLETLGTVNKGYLLTGEDSEATSIEVAADLDKDEICIGNMCFRTNLAPIREVVADAGPPMTAEQVRQELGLETVERVWTLVEDGVLVVVGQNNRRQRLIGAASVMKLKGHSMDANDTMTFEEAGAYLGLAPQGTIPARVKRGDLVLARTGIGASEAKKRGIPTRAPLVTRASVEAFAGTPEHDRALHYAARAAKRLVTQAENKARVAEEPTPAEPEAETQEVRVSFPVSAPALEAEDIEAASRAWGRLSGMIEGMSILARLTSEGQDRLDDAVDDVARILRRKGLIS